MGIIHSLLQFRFPSRGGPVRKRDRSDSPEHTVVCPTDSRGCNDERPCCPSNTGDGLIQSLLRLRFASGTRTGEPVAFGGVCGASVEATYGCHFHLYPTEDPGNSHGTVLGWCLEAAADKPTRIDALELLTLCRIANSCRKGAMLTNASTDKALVLHYAAEL